MDPADQRDFDSHYEYWDKIKGIPTQIQTECREGGEMKELKGNERIDWLYLHARCEQLQLDEDAAMRTFLGEAKRTDVVFADKKNPLWKEVEIIRYKLDKVRKELYILESVGKEEK